MGAMSLTEMILGLLKVASRPMTAADLWRRLPDDVQRDDVGSRLSKMRGRGQILETTVDSTAKTGPRRIKAFLLPAASVTRELVPDLAQTQQNGEIASRQVASIANVPQHTT